jgi:hypothetical protein
MSGGFVGSPDSGSVESIRSLEFAFQLPLQESAARKGSNLVAFWSLIMRTSAHVWVQVCRFGVCMGLR